MIYSKFIKEKPISQNIEANLDLIYLIFKTQTDLQNTINNYEYADTDLVDYYSYNIKAIKAKLSYLIRKAKNQGIIIDRLKQIELKSDELSQSFEQGA